jgi:hypothetical protein
MLGRFAKRAFTKAFVNGYLVVTKMLVPNAQYSLQWASVPVKSFANITEVMEKD